jgi:hypothetical protein
VTNPLKSCYNRTAQRRIRLRRDRRRELTGLPKHRDAGASTPRRSPALIHTSGPARRRRPRRGGGEALDAAVGRARGRPGGPGVERARLPPRRHGVRCGGRAPPPVQRLLRRRATNSHGALKGTPAPSRGFSKQGTRTGSPANPRSQSRASRRRPSAGLETHKKPAFGRTSAPPTQRDAPARGTPELISLTI